MSKSCRLVSFLLMIVLLFSMAEIAAGDSENPPIETVSITLTPPAVGSSASATTEPKLSCPSGAHYVIRSAYWDVSSTTGKITFEAEHIYKLTAVIFPEDEWSFSTNVTKVFNCSVPHEIVSFSGDESCIELKVLIKLPAEKEATKLIAKKKTFKAKTKVKKYTVTLKTKKGKPVKKAKLTLKVGGKTYKATTNSKGKATFKITKLKKKGKYTATIKYAGSKQYKKVTKKVKIIVKK